MRTEPELFPQIVGQARAKRRLKFYLDGYNASNVIPHLMFIAPKGCGKTMLAKAVGKHLVLKDERDKTKPFLEINCSTIKSVKQLFNQIIIPHVNQKECTILFDEASELPKDVTMALLTVLNPNASNRTSFSVEDYVCDFDFSMQSFIFATTEAQHIFHALMDRCERIDLEEYTYGELGQIMGRVLPEVYFEPSALKNVSSVLRGNARAAQKMAMNISTYLASRDSDVFGKKDWKYLEHHLAILPLGLSPIELQVLRFLDGRKYCSLTYLAAKTGLTKSCLQRDFEMYLQKHNLMEITTEGRAITAKGKKYIQKFDKSEKDLEKS